MIKKNEKIQDINILKNQLLKQLQIEAYKIVPDNKKMYIPKYLEEDNLNRILKAREYDLIKAKQMWKKWVEWRIQYNIDQLDPQNFIDELKTGKAFLHKWDKEGNVIVIIQIRKHNPNTTDIQKIMQMIIYFLERGIQISKTGRISIIYDRKIEGSKPPIDKRLIQSMKKFSVMLQDYYAERLAKFFIVHPNWYMNIMYTMFKPFIAKKTQEKIKIFDKLIEINQYISEENLLLEYGGLDKYKYNYQDQLKSVANLQNQWIFQTQGQCQNQEQVYNESELSTLKQNNQQAKIKPSLNNSFNMTESFYTIKNDENEFFTDLYQKQIFQKQEINLMLQDIQFQNGQSNCSLCCYTNSSCTLI